ncbi:MAG: protein kinase [Caldisericales bacterium]|nr:protein kinase [Caldisericia bacterium]NMD14862.1 protein kinase [Caldisericales bacterium]
MNERVLGERFKLKSKLPMQDDIYLALDMESGKDVLIRTILLSSKKAPRWVQFENELATIKQADSPGIVKIIEWGECDGGKYIAYELIEGEKLSQVRLNRDKLIKVLINIANAIDCLHSNDIILTDLKPDNIYIIDEDYNIKIFDFIKLSSDQTSLKQMKTTDVTNEVAWMVPEILRYEERTISSNLYSFGSIGYYLCTGRPPFNDTKISSLIWQIQNLQPTPVSIYNPKIPILLENLVRRLLRKNPKSRPSCMKDVLKVLEQGQKDQSLGKNIISNSGSIINRGLLVGRSKELDLIKSAVLSEEAGLKTLIIDGGHGVGKTRIMQEIASLARSQDMPVLYATCEKINHKKPFGILGQLVCEAALELGFGSFGKSPYKNIFATLCPNIADRLMVGNSPDLEKDPVSFNLSIPKAITWLFNECSQKGRFVVEIDDAQWCDQNSLEIINQSAKEIQNPNMTVVIANSSNTKTTSQNLIGEISFSGYTQTIRLNPFSPAETAELIDIIIGLENISKETTDLLVGASKGNATYLLQMLSGMACRGYITSSGETKKISPDELPTNSNELASWRIGYLDSKLKAILCEAAVIGETFDEQMLFSVTSFEEGDIEETLDEAISSMMLSTFKIAGSYKYKFIENQIRTKLLEETNPKLLISIHDKCAKYIQAKQKTDKNESADELIEHLLDGSNPAKSIPVLLSASIMAESQFAIRQALEYAKKALEASIRASDSSLETVSSLRLAKIMKLQGKFDEAEKTLSGMLSALKKAGVDTDSESEILLALADLEASQAKFFEAQQRTQEAYRLVGRNDEDEKLIKLHLQESVNMKDYDFSQMALHAIKSSDSAIKSQNASLRIKALLNLSYAKYFQGYFSDSLDILEKISAEISDTSWVRMKARFFHLKALLAIIGGSMSQASEDNLMAREISFKMDSQPLLATTLCIDALIKHNQCDLDSVRRLMERAIEISILTGQKMQACRFLVKMAQFQIEDNDKDGAKFYLQRAKDIEKRVPELPIRPSIVLEARIVFEEEQLKKCQDLMDEALNSAHCLDFEQKMALAILNIKLLEHQNEHKKAMALIKSASEKMKQVVQTPYYSCELGLLTAQAACNLLLENLQKTKKSSIISITPQWQGDMAKTAKEALDQAFLGSLSSGARCQSFNVALAYSIYHAIMTNYDQDNLKHHQAETSRYLEIAVQMSDELKKPNLKTKLKRTAEIIKMNIRSGIVKKSTFDVI